MGLFDFVLKVVTAPFWMPLKLGILGIEAMEISRLCEEDRKAYKLMKEYKEEQTNTELREKLKTALLVCLKKETKLTKELYKTQEGQDFLKRLYDDE